MNSEVVGNGGDGIDLEARRSSILDNEARDNGEAGVEFQGQNNVIRGNHACGNGDSNYDEGGTFTFQDNTQTALC